MADQDVELTIDESDSEDSDLNYESLEKIREAVGVGYEKDRYGRRGGIISANLPESILKGK